MKVVSADEAVARIEPGATLGISGFRWVGCPEALLRALNRRFLASRLPRDLTLIFSSAAGDNVASGLALLAQRGLLRRVIGGFWGVTPQLMDLAAAEEIDAYNFPQGQIARLYGAIAAGEPGLVTEIGLDTFVDPRVEGGRLNKRTPEGLVEVVQLRGREYLLYHALPIHAAFIRGTTADEVGNITCEDEAAFTESLHLAFAAHNSGGEVFVQVKHVVPRGSLKPQRVSIPGHVVDYVVVATDIAGEHRQTVGAVYDPGLIGEGDGAVPVAPDSLSGERLIIASRAMRELQVGDVVNLGQGIPISIPPLIKDKTLLASICFTLESGVIGGYPRAVPDFGVAVNPTAIIRHDDQFVFYDGGGLDVAFLGFAEIDAEGSVNVSKFGGRFNGCGGFMDIAQPAKRLVFCGGFRAGKLEVELKDGRVRLVNPGKFPKFVRKLQQRTFSGLYALKRGRPVKYVTERCVFELGAQGLVLTELAEGVDLERDVLAQMEFRPAVSPQLRPMAIQA